MAKLKAGKVVPKKIFGDDAEANTLYHEYKAAKRIKWKRENDSRWQLAAAAGADKFLLIGKPAR